MKNTGRIALIGTGAVSVAVASLRHPAAPERAGIWTASSQGPGPQAVDGAFHEGDWSIVVMNADGSLGVDADVCAGASVPFLNELGWAALGSGAFALVAEIALMSAGIRRPPRSPGRPPAAVSAEPVGP